jgi:hypothetical protein
LHSLSNLLLLVSPPIIYLATRRLDYPLDNLPDDLGDGPRDPLYHIPSMLPNSVTLLSDDAESSRNAQQRDQPIQRTADAERDKSEEAVGADMLEQGGSSDEGMALPRKRQKITRARNACLPVRYHYL